MDASRRIRHAAQPSSSGSASAQGKTRFNLLNQQMIAHIEHLEREGHVDEYFRLCYGLKDTSDKTFFIELVSTFLMDSAAVLDDMTDTLEYPIIDYEKLHELSIKLKGSSSFIGACRLKSGCTHLIQAIVNKHMKECRLTVENLKKEKLALEMKLIDVMKLEHAIVDRQ